MLQFGMSVSRVLWHVVVALGFRQFLRCNSGIAGAIAGELQRCTCRTAIPALCYKAY